MKKKCKNIIGGSFAILAMAVVANVYLISNKHKFSDVRDIEKVAIKEIYEKANPLDNKDAANVLVDHYLYTTKGISRQI